MSDLLGQVAAIMSNGPIPVSRGRQQEGEITRLRGQVHDEEIKKEVAESRASTAEKRAQDLEKRCGDLERELKQFVKRVKDYIDQNSGKYPTEFVFITHVPSGATDYRHLMDLRRRTAYKLKETLRDVYPEVKREFRFLGQIINPECEWQEDSQKLYDLEYVESYFQNKQ